MTLGEMIKQYRAEHGLTQSELAQILQYGDKSLVSRIESNSVKIPLYRARQIADLLNIPIKSIYPYVSEKVGTGNNAPQVIDDNYISKEIEKQLRPMVADMFALPQSAEPIPIEIQKCLNNDRTKEMLIKYAELLADSISKKGE